ncbi:MFS transporter [Rhizobium ruizarguesonis]|uniref:MFS transporter n=1 Tax=Rhizobium ruizarguesonis TaxID=2081791 RepID=UPI001FE00ADB|nr:MFS transporter [Rhizobium ruizarguesonis]
MIDSAILTPARSFHPSIDRPMTVRVLLSSLIGTSVEFYDFYIYATAASLIFGPLFFPASVSSLELIGAYASFGIAFIARPLGGAVFGHFGDRVGRKTTLMASLLMMGISTAAIGLLPTYAVVGWLAPLLLCMLRFGQGLALGGEWTGAVLLALENAPPGWKARFAMFAPLGAPIGFVLANGLFLCLTLALSPEQFVDWGWRVPFLASAPLVVMGLWVRFNLVETPEFQEAMAEAQPANVPLVEVLRDHMGAVVAGVFGVVACFSLYYTVTAFALGYGTSTLGYSRPTFLMVELGAIGFMAVAIVLACWLSDRMEPERVLIYGCFGTIVSGIALSPMLGSGSLFVIFLFLAFSLFSMGFVNGPLGAWLPGLFPARVRYTGTSIAFNIGGIIGGAFSPVAAQALADYSGLVAVGFYLAITGGMSWVAFDASARRRTLGALAQSEKRYRSIFEQSHVSLGEVELAELYQRIEKLRNDRVDISALLVSDPAFGNECSQLIRFVDVNEATVPLLGCASRHDVLGSIDRFLPPSNDLAVSIVTAMSNQVHNLEIETKLLRHDGREVIVVFYIAFPDDAAAYDRVACAMIDVTQREQAKEALLVAQGELARASRVATVGAISASIAHEVNQPIGAVVMFAQASVRWLQTSPPDLAAATKAAERAVEHSVRASQIIQRTRERLKGGGKRPEILDLGELVLDVVGLLERETTSSATTVRIDFARSGSVFADKVELQQVIANLITNGLHAMKDVPEASREITLQIHGDDSEFLKVSVRDHGTGIDEANIMKLFTPFFTTKGDGMGMGLAICKTIVEAHGGSLSARNHGEGGAIFEIVLPIATSGDPAAASEIVHVPAQ